MIETPRTAANCSHQQESETKIYRRFANDQTAPKASGRPSRPIGDCHLTGQNKARWAREEPQHHQYSPRELEQSGKSVKRQEIVVNASGWKAPQLLRAVLDKHESDHEPHQAQNVWRPFRRSEWVRPGRSQARFVVKQSHNPTCIAGSRETSA